ncbi:hypothetical protein QL093DRAFT_2087944 [Fusarium oxysporum]|nr:hypothetical protein QL093DRAFT_2087944 [Fusarium oxysporum]
MSFPTADKQLINANSKLTFHLHNFADKGLLADVNNLRVSIIFKELCDFLNDAEDMRQRQRDRGPQGAQNAFAKGDRSYSAPVGDLTGPNVTTQSASKRPASTDTSDKLYVEKRPTKKPKSQRRRE